MSDGIWNALSKHADGIKHAMFFELKLCTGWSGSEQRLDAWSIPLWPSLGKSIVAYEVKISRADFLKEIKNPDKRQAGLERSNEFYFVTAERVVKNLEEIPEECGWLLYENGELKTIKPAPIRECPQPDWGTIRAICRRAFDFEVIAMKKTLEELVKRESSRSETPTHRVIDQLGDWLIHEAQNGDKNLAMKIKKILEPTDLYQWVNTEQQNGH